MTDVLSGISIWRLQEATDQYLSETKPVCYFREALHKQHFQQRISAGTNVGTASKHDQDWNGILSNVTGTIDVF